MRIVNHRLEGVKFVASPNISGKMTPTGAIMHYTAGYTASSAIQALTSPAAKVSAHLVIDRDGTITQLVPFDRIAWHAGPSVYNGRSGCNSFTIGFEFVNPGFFKVGPKGEVIDAYGTVLSAKRMAEFDMSIRAPDKKIGGGVFIWPGYTDAQIEAGMAAFKAIVDTYGIEFVTGHEDIDTRKWKTDPGDAFPMGRFKDALHGKAEAVMGSSDGMAKVTTRFLVNTPKLNVRNAPNSNAAVTAVLSGGSEVIVIRDLGAWSEVEIAPGRRGYLSDMYLKKAS